MWPVADAGAAAPRSAGAGPTRRAALGAGLAGALGLGAGAAAAAATPAPAARGLVLPRAPAPALPLAHSADRSVSLPAQLRGQVTAVQLMFAGCSATCPVQGGIFAAVARQVRAPDVRLLSLTVDPLGDSPQVLRGWLARFGAHPIWSAAAPRPQDVEPLAAFLRGAAPAATSHTTQVFLFDRQARLAFRTVDLPTPEHVAELLAMLAAA